MGSVRQPLNSCSYFSDSDFSNSTYEFSPLTGLICLHTIDSIEPAPHQAVFDALKAALSRVGLAGGRSGASPGGVTSASS